MRSNWRDCAEWESEQLPLSTTSNEACKLFDAALTQYVSWHEDPTLGGLEGTLKSIRGADQDFVMGRVLAVDLGLIGTGQTPRLNMELKDEIKSVMDLAETQTGLTKREKQHVKAMRLWADGYWPEAAFVWEDILVHHPTDMLALKLAHDTYFYLGKQPELRDSVGRVLPQWKHSLPLHSYLFGMYAFGLEETNFYSKAECMARKALEMNSSDAWATHALAHVFEMEGRTDEGISFLSTTLGNWEPSKMLARHNFWHWALYHIEKGEMDAALDIFDNKIGKNLHSESLLDIVDATSLLYRLQLQGATVGERWHDVYEICQPHLEDHILSFNDAHILMSLLGTKKDKAVDQFIKSMESYIRNGQESNYKVTKEVGLDVCQAMIAYGEGRYDDAVTLLRPLRYRIRNMGGSDAQRDVFNQLMIMSAVLSPDKSHHALAKSLLLERKSQKENSPLTERMMARLLSCHVH